MPVMIKCCIKGIDIKDIDGLAEWIIRFVIESKEYVVG